MKNQFLQAFISRGVLKTLDSAAVIKCGFGRNAITRFIRYLAYLLYNLRGPEKAT